jgi:uncharacterized RDD family membrane protein YckC
MRYVGVGRRLLAVVVDAVVGIVWTYPFLDIERDIGYFHARLGGRGFVGVFLIGVLYSTAMEALFGATVGKFATGLRVVREDGTKLDAPSALIRNTMRLIDFLPFAYLLGAVLVITSPKKQRLGDRIGKTVVVEASSVGVASGPGEPPGAPMWTPTPLAPGELTPPPMPPPPPMPADPARAPGPLPPPDPAPPPQEREN